MAAEKPPEVSAEQIIKVAERCRDVFAQEPEVDDVLRMVFAAWTLESTQAGMEQFKRFAAVSAAGLDVLRAYAPLSMDEDADPDLSRAMLQLGVALQHAGILRFLSAEEMRGPGESMH